MAEFTRHTITYLVLKFKSNRKKRLTKIKRCGKIVLQRCKCDLGRSIALCVYTINGKKNLQ